MKEIYEMLIKGLFKPDTIFFWLWLFGFIIIVGAIIYAIIKAFKKED